MDPEDRRALSSAVHRFGWLFLGLYAAATVSLWLANVMSPDSIGPVTNYTVSVSLTFAVTFGGLYAAWTVLRRDDRLLRLLH